MLCSTLVFNESVSSLSSPILSIIKYVDEQKKFITQENFIIMLLMNKVTHFGNSSLKQFNIYILYYYNNYNNIINFLFTFY